MKLTAETTVFDENAVQNKFSELVVDQDGIRTEVGKKVGDDEVISKINQSAESVQIEASKVAIEADDYVTSFGSDGVKVHPKNDDDDYVAIDPTNGMNVVKGGNLKANFGSEVHIYGGNSSSGANPQVYINGTSAQLIKDSTHYASVDSNGMQVFSGDASNDVASLGSTIRLGKSSTKHVEFDSNGINCYTDSLTKPLTLNWRIDDITYDGGITAGVSNNCKSYCNVDADTDGDSAGFALATHVKTTSFDSGVYIIGECSGNSVTTNYIQLSAKSIECTGQLIVNNHSTAIGSTLYANLTTAKTATRNTEVNLLSLSLPAGTWVIESCVTFPTGMGGIVAMGVNTSRTGIAHQAQTAGNNYGATKLCAPYVVTPSSTTMYYLNVYNATSANLTIAAGSLHNGTYMYATRIA